MSNKPILNKTKLLELLTREKIPYVLHNHEPFFTVKDAENNRKGMTGEHTKNIFLKNKKNEFFLLSCSDKQTLDLKKISKVFKLGNISFAKEDKLYEILGVLPGSVSPFGLLNDKKNLVKFYLDNRIAKSKEVNFHPLENTSTITISVKDFTNFMIKRNKLINTIDYETYSFIC